MRFYFDSDQVEAGFVWLRDDQFNQLVEVTAGLGSKRNFGQYNLPRRDRGKPIQLSGEKICRIAIAQFLKNTATSFQDNGHIDETDEPWSGVLSPIPDFKRT